MKRGRLSSPAAPGRERHQAGKTPARSRLRIYLDLLLLAALILGLGLAWKPLLAHRYRSQAQSAMLQRDDERALERLQRAERLRPHDAETHFQLARTYRRLGQPKNAQVHLDLARRNGGDARRAEREQWLLWAQMGRLRDAVPHLNEFFDAAREDQREACEAYVRGYLANLRLAEAQELLTAWTSAFPDDPEAWFLQGSKHEMLSRFAEAADAYRRAAQLAPDRLDVKLRWSGMLVELRRMEESHRLLAECVAAHPDDPAVLLAWSRSLQAQGDLAQAEQSLRRLLQIAPDHVEGQVVLGEIALARQNYEEAVRRFTGAVAERPRDVAARYNLAKALLALGRGADAQPHLDFVAEAQPALERIDDLALEAVQRPEDGALRFEVGALLWKYGSPDDAARWIGSVLELEPDHPGARQILAEYLAMRGKKPAN